MRLGICIPCYYGHIGYLDCVLTSIDRQTLLPDKVSICISSYPKNKEKIKIDTKKYDVIITTVNENKNAAENRNIAAASIIDDVDIISFIDADDYCVPERNEVIMNTFKKYECDLFLHDYYNWSVEEQQKHVNDILLKLNKEKCIFTDVLKERYYDYFRFGQIYIENDDFNIHNAHVSIKSSLFKKQPFPEDEHLYSYEDSQFNYLHFKSGAKIIASSLKLSLYATNKNQSIEEAYISLNKKVLEEIKNTI